MRTTVRLARFVAAAELPIILAIAPALLFPTPTRLVVLAVVPVIWLCARITSGRSVPRTPMNAALWLMLLMVGVSLFATFDILFSLGKVSGVVLGVLLFWAISRWLTTTDRLKVGAAVLLLAGTGLAVVGLLGLQMPTSDEYKFSALGKVARRLPTVLRGVLPGAEAGFNPNAVAGCLVLFVPLQVTLLATGFHRWLFPVAGTRWPTRWLVIVSGILGQVILLCLTAFAVLITQSRDAWLALAVAILAFLVWYGVWTRVLATVAATALVVLSMALRPENLIRMAISQLGPGIAETVSRRVNLWSKAIYGIRDFPFTGMGMNAFRKVGPIRYQANLGALTGDVAHAHNHLLQAALDLGIPGLIAYTSIWMVAGLLLVIVYRRSDQRIYRAMAGGLGAGFIAHFVFSMADAIPLGAKVGVLFWLTLAFTVALHRVALARASSE